MAAAATLFRFLISGVPSNLNSVVSDVTGECLLSLDGPYGVVDDHIDLPQRYWRSGTIRINKISYLYFALHADRRLAVIRIPLYPINAPPVICRSDNSILARRRVDI